MNKSRRIAGLRISRVTESDGVIMGSNSSTLPDLAPPEDRLKIQRRQIFSSDAIALSQIEENFEPSDRLEHQDLVARITVYAVNLTVMVFAVPVGVALLFLNILGGENLRTTAHAMALTGMYSGLALASPGLFSAII